MEYLPPKFYGGVESFFVISAYFLTKKLINNEEVQIGNAIANRIKRLYPQYVIVLLGAVALCVVVKKTFPVKDAIIHLLSLQNFNWMASGYTSDLVTFTAHTWTLAIEIWLSVLWLIGFKLLRNKSGRVCFCIGMLVIAVGYRIVSILTVGDIYVTSLFPIAHADAFAVGSLMAIGLLKKDKRDIFYGALLIIGVVLLVGCFAYTANEFKVSIGEGYKLYKTSDHYLANAFTGNVYLAITLISSGLLFFSLKCLEVKKWVKPLVLIGDISYTGYLIHWPIRVVVIHFVNNPWVAFVVVLIITVVGSIIIDNLIAVVREKIAVRR